MFRRLARWILLSLLVALAVFAGFAWTVTHPPIGQPLALPADSQEKLWTFAFVGDTHTGMTSEVAPKIVAAIAAARPEFVLHLGDMVDQGESEQQWQQFIDLARSHRLRLLPVVGNHDVLPSYSDKGEIRFRRHFPWLPATHYHFRHRGVNFLMLNSELSLLPGTKQAKFLARQLVEHPGTAVLCWHRPAFTCSERDWGNKYWRQLWVQQALAGSEAALALTGHNHYYERTKPLGEIVYVTSGGGTSNVYDAVRANPHTAVFVAGKPHYGLADVYADRIQVRALALDGELLDQFAVPLRPAALPPGHQENPGSIELPPIAELPAFTENAENLDIPRDQMPRPW